jgi:hypothetical protein
MPWLDIAVVALLLILIFSGVLYLDYRLLRAEIKRRGRYVVIKATPMDMYMELRFMCSGDEVMAVVVNIDNVEADDILRFEYMWNDCGEVPMPTPYVQVLRTRRDVVHVRFQWDRSASWLPLWGCADSLGRPIEGIGGWWIRYWFLKFQLTFTFDAPAIYQDMAKKPLFVRRSSNHKYAQGRVLKNFLGNDDMAKSYAQPYEEIKKAMERTPAMSVPMKVDAAGEAWGSK